MVGTAELMIGGMGLLTALASGYGALEQYRYRQSVDTDAVGIPETDATATLHGPAEECEKTVTAPFTGEEALAAAVLVETRETSRAGFQPSRRVVRAAPFRLTADGRRVEVDATAAEFDELVTSDANTTEVVVRESEDLPAHAREHDEFSADGPDARYTEVRVPPGSATVVGRVTDADPDAAACTNVESRVDADDEGPFQLSDLPPEELRGARSLRSIAFRAGVAVAALAVAVAVFVL